MSFATDFIEAGLGSAVVIDWYSDAEFVHVVGKRQHRFEIHKDRAIEVLQVAHQRDLFSHQLKLAFATIQEWMDLHEDLVCTCFLTLRDSHLLLIVVPTQVECSDDLEDLVSDLDLKIASDAAMDLLKLNTIVLPYASEESMKSFFDERCLMAFPHREKAK